MQELDDANKDLSAVEAKLSGTARKIIQAFLLVRRAAGACGARPAAPRPRAATAGCAAYVPPGFAAESPAV